MAHGRKAVGDSRRQTAREAHNKTGAKCGREEAGRRAESEWAESGRAKPGSLSGREVESGAGREAGRSRDGVCARLQGRIAEELTECHNMDGQELLEHTDTTIRDMGQGIYLPLKERIWLRGSLYDSFRRLGILQELIGDRSVSEIMVNGVGTIFIERNGRVKPWKGRFRGPEQLGDIVQQIMDKVNRVANVSLSIVGARLEDGSKVYVALSPVLLDGPVVAIRKFPEPITTEELIHSDVVTREGAEFLQKLAETGYNMLIDGGINPGETTFLDALLAYVPTGERAVTIEDSAEPQITRVPDLVRVEIRNANTGGEGEITTSQLIRASLRTNSSRIIVGEVRGGETLDMLQAMNTGYARSPSTGHGNSPRDITSRLETMVLMAAELPLAAIRGRTASALDVMIYLGRLRDGSRKVPSVTEIGEYKNEEVELEPLYEYNREKGVLRKRGELMHREKLGTVGYCQRREEGKTG